MDMSGKKDWVPKTLPSPPVYISYIIYGLFTVSILYM